jgi:hypothetical protein
LEEPIRIRASARRERTGARIKSEKIYKEKGKEKRERERKKREESAKEDDTPTSK